MYPANLFQPTRLLLYHGRLRRKISHCDKESALALERGHGKFLLKKKKKEKNASSCLLAGGGWKASKQFPEHDNHALLCNSVKTAEQKFTKLSGGKKEITFELRTSLINSNPKGELETATGF